MSDKHDRLLVLASRMKPMHLAMAKLLAAGTTQEKAYIRAGGKGKDPRQSAHQIILTNIDIAEYVELANAIAAEEAQESLEITVAKKHKWLKEIIEDAMASSDGDAMQDRRSAISAIAELNKMAGDYAAIKTDNRTTHRFRDLTDDELDDHLRAALEQEGYIRADAGEEAQS